MSEDTIRREISGVDELLDDRGADRDRGDGDTDELTERMERALAELDVPGRKASVKEARRDAVRRTWHRLREMSEAETRELANPAYDEFGDDSGYSEGFRRVGVLVRRGLAASRHASRGSGGVLSPQSSSGIERSV